MFSEAYRSLASIPMSNVLIGRELGEDLFRLNAELRRTTVEEFNRQAAEPATAYSPWMCMFPVLNGEQIPQTLLRQPTYERGGLVMDIEYLTAARAFMEPRTEMTRNGIFDQAHADWIPTTEITAKQKDVFDAGRTTLLSASPTLARMYLELIDYVLPLEGQRNRGTSNHFTRGAIRRTVPDDADRYDVAIDLAHEMGHYSLVILQSIDSIIVPADVRKPVYSQIRQTLRPAIQTLHAAVALASMHLFVESMPNDPACQAAGERRGKKYTKSLKHSLYLSIESLRQSCEFTPLGARVLEEMEALI